MEYKLQKYREDFVAELDSVTVQLVIDGLFSKHAITRLNKGDLEYIENADKQVRELLDLLDCKGPKVINQFYEILKTENPDLADLLKPNPPDDSAGDSGGRAEARGANPPPPKSSKQEQNVKQLYKVLVLHGNDEFEILKKKRDVEFEQSNCEDIINELKGAASYDSENVVILILGNFDGETVKEIISSGKIRISEICATLKQFLPGKNKICVLINSKKYTKKLSSRVEEASDETCLLAALREDRLEELLEEFEKPTGEFFPRIKNFFESDEKIWPKQEQNVKEYQVLVLQGNTEFDTLKRNDEFVPSNCNNIIDEIKGAASLHPQNFMIFILGNFDGETVEEVISCRKIPISEICATLKEIYPGQNKICVLLHSEYTKKLRSLVEEAPDYTCLLVALREHRLEELLKEFKENPDYFPVIKNFINPDEQLWPDQV